MPVLSCGREESSNAAPTYFPGTPRESVGDSCCSSTITGPVLTSYCASQRERTFTSRNWVLHGHAAATLCSHFFGHKAWERALVNMLFNLHFPPDDGVLGLTMQAFQVQILGARLAKRVGFFQSI